MSLRMVLLCRGPGLLSVPQPTAIFWLYLYVCMCVCNVMNVCTYVLMNYANVCIMSAIFE